MYFSSFISYIHIMKIIKRIIVLIPLLAIGLACSHDDTYFPQDEYSVVYSKKGAKKDTQGLIYTYGFSIVDNLWHVVGVPYTYRNRFVLKGTPPGSTNQEKDVFVVLTNKDSINYNQCINHMFSSLGTDLFKPEETLIVQSYKE